jgi:flagellar protein FliS
MASAEMALNQYRRMQIGTSSPAKLVVLMYEGAARFLERAACQLERGEIEDSAYWLDRSMAIVQELLETLDFEHGGGIASQLGGVYTMSLREMLRARLRKDAEILRKLSRLYIDLKQGWEEIAATRA